MVANSTVLPGSNIWIAYGCILAVLMAGTSVTGYLARLYPDRDYTELRLRVRTWWVIVPPVLAALFAGPVAVTFLFALASGVALREYFDLAGGSGLPRPVVAAAYLAIPIQFELAYAAVDAGFAAFVPLLCLALGAAVGKRAGMLAVGLMLAVYSLSHVARLSALAGGPGLVTFLLMITQLNDVAQYVWGKILGRTPLAPALSPGKTREGMLGGLATSAVLAALIGPLLTPLDMLSGMAAGVALALAGVAGDLSVSAIKRDAGVKDAGDLLPGHGGLLDRVDSLIYAAPLFFYGMLAWRAMH